MMEFYKQSYGIGKGIYPERTLGYFFGALTLIVFKLQAGGLSVFDIFLLGVFLAYPHLAFVRFKRYGNQSRHEVQHLLFDIVLIAIFLYQLGFDPYISLCFLVVNVSTNIGVGGIKLLVYSAVFLLATVTCLVFFFGFDAPETIPLSVNVLAGAHLLLGISAYNYVDYLRGQKFIDARRKIKAQNEQIRSALEENNILLKEVHHRVKNNLQIVFSLLNLQSETISDPKAKQALSDSTRRIKSMALLHQLLYREQSVDSVNISEYLKQLVETIKSSYPQQVHVNYDMDSIYIGNEVAVSLGLIANELVSNSFKHGGEGLSALYMSAKTVMGESTNNLVIEIFDNGTGFQWDSSYFDRPYEQQSFGLELVKDLVMQLRGDIQHNSQGGSKYVLSVPIV